MSFDLKIAINQNPFGHKFSIQAYRDRTENMSI